MMTVMQGWNYEEMTNGGPVNPIVGTHTPMERHYSHLKTKVSLPSFILIIMLRYIIYYFLYIYIHCSLSTAQFFQLLFFYFISIF